MLIRLPKEEERTNTETASVMLRTSERLLIRDTMTAIQIQVEGALSVLILATLTANPKGAENLILAVLETLVLYII